MKLGRLIPAELLVFLTSYLLITATLENYENRGQA